MKKRYRITNLRVNEIAFVDRGANQEADVVFWKRDEKPTIADFLKEHMEGRSFDEITQDREMSELADEMWEVTDRLRQSIFEILFDEDDQKSSRISSSIMQFADVVDAELASELTKNILSNYETTGWTGDLFKLLSKSEGSGGQPMPKKGTPVIEGVDLSKLSGEEIGILTTIVEKGGQFDAIQTQLDELKTANDTFWQAAAYAEAVDVGKKNSGDPDDQDAILKDLDPAAREIIKAERSRNAELLSTVRQLKKNGRMTVIAKQVSELEAIAEEDEKIVEVLQKADEAGIYEDVLAMLQKADKLAQRGLGDGSNYGANNDGAGASTAEQKLDGIAKDLVSKDMKLTHETAFAKAMTDNPSLYTQYLKETGQHVRN